MKRIATLLLVLGMTTGCATNLPTSSSLNDYVVIGTKTNSTESVLFNYESNITDGFMKPFERDKDKEVWDVPGFYHSESSTLGKILKEYFENKFTNLSPGGETVIKVTLKDFWVEQYATDTDGKKFAVAMAGGSLNYSCVAKVKVVISVTRNGVELTKNINTSTEDVYSYGPSRESIILTHARNINNANNKIAMMMNSYFQEIGL